MAARKRRTKAKRRTRRKKNPGTPVTVINGRRQRRRARRASPARAANPRRRARRRGLKRRASPRRRSNPTLARRRGRRIRRRKNPSGLSIGQFALAIGAGAATLFGVNWLMPKILPIGLIEKPVVYGLVLSATGIGLGFGLGMLSPAAGLGSGIALGTFGTYLSGVALYNDIRANSAQVTGGASAKTLNGQQAQTGIVDLGIVAPNLGRVDPQLGAVEMMLGAADIYRQPVANLNTALGIR